jgi:hypothetical protein
MPGHEFFDKPVVYSALSFNHGQDLRAEDLFELFQICLGEAIKGPAGSKKPVSHDGVEMGMKPGVIPEGVDHHDHAEDAVIQAQHRAEEHLQALVGAMAKLCQELAVVFEIDAKHLRDAEDKLPMRDRIEYIVGDVFAELNRFFGMATRAEEAIER